MTQQGTLTCHIWTGEDNNLLLRGVQIYVIGNVLFPGGHKGFYHGMTALTDVQNLTVIHFRAAVMHLDCLLGKTCQYIQFCKDTAVGLDVRDEGLNLEYEFCEESLLYCQDLVLRSEDFFLVFLKFLRYIALRVYQSLLTDPLRRNLVLVGVTDLNVIAKNIVVGYFKAAYTGSFHLPLLHLEKVILTPRAEAAEFVKICVDARADNRPLTNLDCRFRSHHALDFLHKGGAVLHSLEEFCKGLGAIGQSFPYGGR